MRTRLGRTAFSASRFLRPCRPQPRIAIVRASLRARCLAATARGGRRAIPCHPFGIHDGDAAAQSHPPDMNEEAPGCTPARAQDCPDRRSATCSRHNQVPGPNSPSSCRSAGHCGWKNIFGRQHGTAGAPSARTSLRGSIRSRPWTGPMVLEVLAAEVEDSFGLRHAVWFSCVRATSRARIRRRVDGCILDADRRDRSPPPPGWQCRWYSPTRPRASDRC